MKLLRKTHFWQDKRTWIEIEGELPLRNERGYAEEGTVSIRIGDENGLKASFKLSVDEARAVEDVISLFAKKHDSKMTELMSSRGEYSQAPASQEPLPSFELFDVADRKEEEPKEKPKLDFYY